MMEDNVPGFIGYHITRDGKLYSRRIERSPSKFNEVMHLDNNPLNNHYRNLQWSTHSMNIQQMIFEQRRKSFKTIQNPNWENFKISDRKLRRLNRLLSLGNSRIYISKRLKVSRKTLYNFIHRIQIRNSLE